MKDAQRKKMGEADGFIAALDQSGGSTPKALGLYGVTEDRWSNEKEMFDLVHEMRTRIITSPSFTGERVLAAILFENTMKNTIAGQPTADFLWNQKQIVPILKVDKGLAEERDGVQLMKPMPTLTSARQRKCTWYFRYQNAFSDQTSVGTRNQRSRTTTIRSGDAYSRGGFGTHHRARS